MTVSFLAMKSFSRDPSWSSWRFLLRCFEVSRSTSSSYLPFHLFLAWRFWSSSQTHLKQLSSPPNPPRSSSYLQFLFLVMKILQIRPQAPGWDKCPTLQTLHYHHHLEVFVSCHDDSGVPPGAPPETTVQPSKPSTIIIILAIFVSWRFWISSQTHVKQKLYQILDVNDSQGYIHQLMQCQTQP